MAKEEASIQHVANVPPAEEIQEAVENEKQEPQLTSEQQRKLGAFYRRKSDHGSDVAPDADIMHIFDRIQEMSTDDALDIVLRAIEFHKDDQNFPQLTMAKIKVLVKGPKAASDITSDYEFDLKAEAAIIHYHSPYPEVRSVTDAYDDPAVPVETFRAYFLGLTWMAGATALNTFFSPRQPTITLSSTVLQLLLAPCGFIFARVLPDWGVTVFGTRHSLNPGPWSYKEQMFATIIFNVGNGTGGTYYVYLVQKLPQYLNQKWVTFAYEIILALSIQCFGLGFAGLLRRFVIKPITAIWFKVLPTLALNRALLIPEKKGEVVNGWKIPRYRFFVVAAVAMFFYFWIPNSLFTALHAFNWMTWISPQNFNVGMVTGFYGGLGFNPVATFDWNVSGTGMLVTPFFSTLQQYGARVLSGLIIIAMYWGNNYWSAYMPINSNEAFDNKAQIYNISRVLTEDSTIDVEKYKEYGPPYFSGCWVLGQGSWFAWYPMTLFYVSIRQFQQMKIAAITMYEGIVHRKAFYDEEEDAHSRMMSKYKEVPDWWFLGILLFSLALGIIALQVYPLNTPVWVLFAVVGISAVFLVPSALLMAQANVNMGFNVLFQLLGGVWFVGNPLALIIVTAYGQNFNVQAENYISDQKMAHYAKIPPRAIFRGQIISVFCNCFIFIGMLNWMVDNFNNGTLCTWSNKSHFVCTEAVLVFSSAIEYGTFGVRNMFKMYPILPWCFLMGAAIGTAWALVQKYGSKVKDYSRKHWKEGVFSTVDKYLYIPMEYLAWFDPAVFWAGSLNWSGGNNLSYATNGLYISYIFMHHIKRRYGPWWEKYNYLLEAGFDVGVAVSGIIQTFALDFATPVNLNWWGNTVATAGVDFESYNQKAPLLPVPQQGYFGLPPEKYPMEF
ncbi:oligopeptide transporter 6 [Lecanicillium sp. MT-2017a]|nr:oligopeptide transporter 6 [Lecanicillium sp. MT-2017a]